MYTEKQIDFIPEAAVGPWDRIEVDPVLEEEGYCSRIDHTDLDTVTPSFWSVYLHQVSGGVQCIADLPTEELAKKFADLIDKASKSKIKK